jgi:hypothetical protein
LEGTMITFPEGAVDEVVKLHKQGKLSKADVREAIGKLTDLALENATEEIEEYMAEMAALSDEDRLRLLAPIALAATALNAMFKPKVDANDFTMEVYEQVGEAFVRLDRQKADAVSSDYIHSARASDEVREASNRAWITMDELRRTLDRAYKELERRDAAGVPSIEELAVRRGVA